MSTKSPPTIHQTDASHTQKRVERCLLQLSIFLIPSSLAYHFDFSGAYSNGRLIDYLLPKLYLSDIPIILIIIIFLFNNRYYIGKSLFKSVLIILFIFYLLLNSFLSPNPLSSTWFDLKIIEFILFGAILVKSYTDDRFISAIRVPLAASILLQLIVSLYQYIHHSSIFGYYFFGEPNLESVGVATTITASGLEVIPYGTTVHPNVLAGFLIVSFLILLHSAHLSPKYYLKKASNIVVTGLILIIFYFTRSFSALSGGIITILLNLYKKYISSLNHRLIFLIISPSILLVSLLIFPIFHQLNLQSDSPSFYERYELNQVAFLLIWRHPLFGIGPNLFTQYLPHFPLSRQQSYLLQPVHNGLLLLLSETGLVGLFLIILLLRQWYHQIKAAKPSFSAFLPVVCLFIILQLDHYPITLQTGQLLLTLSLVLPALKPNP